MRVTVSADVFRKFPPLKVVLISVALSDQKTHLHQSAHLLQEVEKVIRLTFNRETALNHHLLSPWQVIKQGFGAKAKHYQTSVENLLQSVLNKKGIVEKDTCTNLIHYLSLKHIVPIGMDDVHLIKGNITFALGTGKEKYKPILHQGELYYHDAAQLLGTNLDYWKNKKTAVSSKTTSALVHLEILPPITDGKLHEILQEASRLFSSFCGAKTNVMVLDRKKRSAVV